jgi:hypothetical protein
MPAGKLNYSRSGCAVRALRTSSCDSCRNIAITLIDPAATLVSLAVAVRKNLFRFPSWANSSRNFSLVLVGFRNGLPQSQRRNG